MDNKIIAMWGLSNFGGVAVLELNDDSMVVQYYDDEPVEVEIEYEYNEENEDYDRNYIMIGQLRLYLDECMRV